MAESQSRSSLAAVIGILVFFFIAIFACTGAIIGAASAPMLNENSIGVIEIKGPITSADQTVQNIHEFSANPDIKAILIRINSPGGSVSASQEIVEAIQTIKKPSIISMGDMAASGGYYVACAGPKIYASQGTLTGSIGVISQVMEYGDLMRMFKINVHTVKTGDLKDAGSPFRPFNDNDKAYFTHLGLEILDQFVEHVATARNIPKEKVSEIADGRVWTGREAKNLGLIDEIGGMNAAITTLMKDAGLSGNYTLFYPEKSTADYISSLLSQGASETLDSLKSNAQKSLQNTESFQYLFQY